jgi:hypothetical protein
LFHEKRLAADGAERAHRRIDAAGNVFQRLGKKFFGFSAVHGCKINRQDAKTQSRMEKINKPSGTKEPFCRPSRDFSIGLTLEPAINGWAMVIASLSDWRTPIAPIVHPKMNSGKEQLPMRNSECEVRSAPIRRRFTLA